MQIKFENPKPKQSGTTDQLGYSSSTLQRYRNDINMLSLCRIQPNITNKRTKKFQIRSLITIHITNMTSRDINWPQITLLNLTLMERTSGKKNKNTLKAGSVHENIVINDN